MDIASLMNRTMIYYTVGLFKRWFIFQCEVIEVLLCNEPIKKSTVGFTVSEKGPGISLLVKSVNTPLAFLIRLLVFYRQ